MAAGFDELIEFLLSEIALCSVEGAGSADFRRFIREFYEEKQLPGGFGRTFYEKVWDWVSNHGDIRIVYGNEARNFSLAEFEALELQETGANGADDATELQSPSSKHRLQLPSTPPAEALQLNVQSGTPLAQSSFQSSLRQRLLDEGHAIDKLSVPRPTDTLQLNVQPIPRNRLDISINNERVASQESTWTSEHIDAIPAISSDTSKTPQNFQSTKQDSKKRGRRKVPKGIRLTEPLFDDPSASTTAPRLYASQNRTWYAIAGHSIDLKRLPSMEFALLSIIAAQGASGIAQPDLVKVSGQDKRSVPHRTDELAKKGYIEKQPVQARKIRTSLCVHKRFVQEGHFLKGPGVVEDVFRDKSFIMSGFADLLYNLLKNVRIIAMRDLRRKLGVSTQEWTQRAVRFAVLRLHETGFLKRCRARKKGSKEVFLVCIKLLRPPNEEDVKNLNFRRKVNHAENPDILDPLESDEAGDALERDLDLEVDSDDIDRIPPQWTPNRLMANLIFEATDLSGSVGSDSSSLRDITVGKFWKRPMESYIGRLTDNWEQSQPLHLRHLALIRDTALTTEKKFIHYVYRTHGNYQKAIDEKGGSWEAVSKEALTKSSEDKQGPPKKGAQSGITLDPWGFLEINVNSFHRRDGSSTLTECRAAIDRGTRQGPHWDNALAQEMGYEKNRRSGAKYRPSRRALTQNEIMVRDQHKAETERKRIEQYAIKQATREARGSRTLKGTRKQQSVLGKGPTIQQRLALGLPPRGRLGFEVEAQIQAYRKKTGDPTAMPEVITREARPTRNPLLAREERLVQGLPEIPKAINPPIGLERGVPTSFAMPKNGRTKRVLNEPPLLTKEQRIARGLPERGRLKQSVIDEILRERDIAISSERTNTPASTEPDRDKEAVELTDFETQDNPEGLPASVTSPSFIDLKSHRDRIEIGIARLSAPTSTTHAVSQPEDALRTLNEESSVPPLAEAIERTPSSDTNQATGVPPVLVSLKRKVDELSQSSGPQAKKTRVETALPATAGPRASSYPTKKNPVALRSGPTKLATPELDTRVQEIIAKVTQRPRPGVYINPFATRPIPRGRPRRALMAIFKSARLMDMEWFQPDPNVMRTFPLPRSAIRKATPRQSQHVLEPSATVEPSPSGMSGIEHHNASPVVTSGGVDELKLGGDIVPPIEEQKASLAIEEFPSRLPAWNAINASVPRQPTTYQSPYAPTPVAQSLAPTPTETETEAGNASVAVSITSASVRGTPAATEEELDFSNAPEIRTISYSETRKRRTVYKHGVVLGRGNVWRLRTSIIHEILLRCNGLYPGNGEIAAPFYTLWDQRAGKNMVRPDRSTLTSTLKNMINDPEHKLKKFTFIMPSAHGSTNIERSIIAFTKVMPSSLEVKKLQRNMIITYPKRFYPEEIRELVSEEPTMRTKTLPEIDNSIEVSGMYPPTARKLDQRILASFKNRNTEMAKKKQNETKAPKPQNVEVKKTLLKRAQPRVDDRAKLPRLATLKDGPQRYQRKMTRPHLGEDRNKRTDSPARSKSSEDIPLSVLRPLQSKSSKVLPSNGGRHDDDNDSSSDEEAASYQAFTTLMDPSVCFYPSNGTFSTEFVIDPNIRKALSREPAKAASNSVQDIQRRSKNLDQTEKGRKRVRIAEESVTSPRKKPCIENQGLDLRVYGSRLDSDEFLGSNDDDDYVTETSHDEDDEELSPRPKARHRRSQDIDEPTLAQRLTGLTGNPDDPIYVPPVRKNYEKKPKRWTLTNSDKQRKPKKVAETLDPVDKFKKLCYSLIIASCMSGEDGWVDWEIVTNIYASDKAFDLPKAKNMWSWMQINMTSWLKTLSSTFQSSFLEAYENGKIASIEDPATYDWASLVQWALKHCQYPQPPLPADRSALCEYDVEESTYETFPRVDWYKKELSHVGRTQRLLHYAYANPLDIRTESRLFPGDKVSLARSWVRANTATPQAIYDGNLAHEKLSVLGIYTLEQAVLDLVDDGVLRMRKLKRLLPGRNYNFMTALALLYRRTFEVEDFIDAVKFKKTLDTAFACEDTKKRTITVAQTANNGAVMALLSLVNEGRVKLIPKLPPINNSLGAPLPRLSVWGFSEGDYVHRAIDRNRLFWDIDAVPTSTYQFGNPLDPTSSTEAEHLAVWPQLTEPPLPGKHNAHALLPIWSSIDGQTVTWPWWNRTLNLVLQSIMFQPGISVAEIHRNCPNNAMELFEVDLIVSWLLEVSAIKNTTPGTFEVKPGFWAAFGDCLIDNDDDWFGKHVKRKKATSMEWRQDYNLKFATLNNDVAGQATAMSEEFDEADGRIRGSGHDQTAIHRILQRPRQQYRAVKEAVEAPAPSTNTLTSQVQPGQEDVVMVDADVDAEGDLDAEGEVDDEML